jgi:acyl-CoA synthetase (AMP-forming)/AMP-acid ligase II
MAPEPYRPLSYLEHDSRTAVWDAGAEISFAQLLDRVRLLQQAVAGHGVRHGDVVGVQLANVSDYVALELAIPDMGAVILPLPLSLGEHEMRWIHDKARPSMVIREPELSGSGTPAIAGADPDRIVEIALTSARPACPSWPRSLLASSRPRSRLSRRGWRSRRTTACCR